MTTTTATSDSNRFIRLAGGWSLLAAGPLILGGLAFSPSASHDAAVSRAAMAASSVRAQVSATLLAFGFAAMVPAVLMLYRLLSRRTSALANSGLALGVLGFALLPGLLAVDYYEMSLAQTLSESQAAAVSDKLDTYAGHLVSVLPAKYGSVLGLALLAIALWRTHAMPAWVPAAIGVGIVGVGLLPGSAAAGVAFGALLAAGLIAVGLHIVRHVDAEQAPATTPSPVLAGRASALDG